MGWEKQTIDHVKNNGYIIEYDALWDQIRATEQILNSN